MTRKHPDIRIISGHAPAPTGRAEQKHRAKLNGKEAPQPRIKLIPFDEIEVGGEPLCLVRGLIPRVGLTVAWGPPKSGKSFWTFDMAMHVALGWDYRGRRVQRGPVIYCAFEGQSGIRLRCAAFRQRFLSEQAEGIPFYLQPLPLDLVKCHDELVTVIRTTLGSGDPVLVVLDTLNRSLGGSESRDEDMAAYIRAADVIRETFGCAVLVVHHCGVNDSRPRGHTSLTGAADAQLAIKRDANQNIITTLEWMKDGGGEGDTIGSRLEVEIVGADQDGTPITSCVVLPAEVAATKEKPSKVTGAAKIALDMLKRAVCQGGETPPASNHISKNTKAVTLDHWRRYYYLGVASDASQAAKKKAFGRAVERLQAAGAIGVWEAWVWPT